MAYADRIVSEITAPTLVIWGDEDQLIPVSSAQTFDERMINADVVIYEGVSVICLWKNCRNAQRWTLMSSLSGR